MILALILTLLTSAVPNRGHVSAGDGGENLLSVRRKGQAVLVVLVGDLLAARGAGAHLQAVVQSGHARGQAQTLGQVVNHVVVLLAL